MSGFVAELYRKGIVKSGNFRLKSGMTSPFYVDCKKIVQFPLLLNRIADAIIAATDLAGIDWVCGVPDGAVPFASVVSCKTGIPLLLARKQAKSHGLMDQVPNGPEPGDGVLVIEDVVTTGGSLESFCATLERHALVVKRKLCIVNRGLRGPSAIIPLPFLNGTPHPGNPLLPKLGNRVIWAADCGSMDEMLVKMTLYGPRIAIIKTHMDTFADFSPEKLDLFLRLKDKYGLLVWEDRKFADIGTVMSRQIKNSPFKYERWVDLFSLHAITGRESVECVFKENPSFRWILIGQLSSKGNLIDTAYTESVKNIYRAHEEVVGMVCQDYLGQDFVHIVPGVSGDNSGDMMGQSYSRPQDKVFADFLVAGRSIDKVLGQHGGCPAAPGGNITARLYEDGIKGEDKLEALNDTG